MVKTYTATVKEPSRDYRFCFYIYEFGFSTGSSIR